MDLAIVAAFAGLIVLVALTWRLFQPAPRLEVGERGILDRGLRLGWIRWDEIDGAYLRPAEGRDAVFVRLRVTERLRRRLHRIRNREAVEAGSFDVRLDLSDTGVSAVELVQEILAHADRSAGAAALARRRPEPLR